MKMKTLLDTLLVALVALLWDAAEDRLCRVG